MAENSEQRTLLDDWGVRTLLFGVKLWIVMSVLAAILVVVAYLISLAT